MKEALIQQDIKPSREVVVEELRRLPTEERVDVAAGRLCNCPDCQNKAKPVLERHPNLTTLTRREVRPIWERLKEGGK
jgi:hypothetical protein